MTTILGVVARAVLLLIAAPAGAAVTPGSFTGRVQDEFMLAGAHVSEAAAAGGQTIRLYLCNSTPVAEWFVGPVLDGRATLTSKSGGATAAVEVGQDTVSGTADLGNGRPVTFAIARSSGG